MSAEWNFLITLNERLRPVKDAIARQEVAVQLLGEYLHANRVHYAHIDGDEYVISQAYEDGVAPFADRGPIAQFGKAVVEACRRGETVAVDDVRTDARISDAEREQLLAHDAAAFIGMPLMKDGQWQATFGVHSATPRAWTRDQIALVEVTAERTWGAGERARAEAALDQSQTRQAFLRHLNDQIRPLADPTRILEESCRVLGMHLRVNRVIYAEINGEDCMVVHDYVDGVPSLTGHMLWRNMVGSRADEILANWTLVANDITSATHTPEERASLEAAEIRAYLCPLLIKDGRFVGAFGLHSRSPRAWTLDEITLTQEVADRIWAALEHRKAEADLRANEERLRLALEASAGGSWTWDARTNDVNWDAAFRAGFGFAPDESPSFEHWLARVHDEDRVRLRAALDDVLLTKDRWDQAYRMFHPDHGPRWMQSLGRAHRDASGRVTRLTGLELDITDRRRSEDAFQARRDEDYNRTLRTLLETSTQGIVAADTGGILIFANRAVEVMFGSPADELVGQPLEGLIPLIFADGLASAVDLTGRRTDGSYFPIDVTVTRVPTPSGVRTFAFVTDITERQRVAAALQERTSEIEYRTTQLSQMAWDLTLAEHHAREQIARTLHDGLQQLLVIVSLNLDQELKRDTALTAPSELVSEAKQQIDEAIDVARSLNIELFPPVLQRSGLPAALTWLANWKRDKYKIHIEVDIDPRADSARKDIRTLLFESTRELLFNAVKYAKTDRVALSLELDAHNELCITVTDHGVGFEPSRLDDRSKSVQTGWGLFRMRERLTLLGGRMDIDSAPGRGTKVRLVAPRAVPQQQEVAEPDVPSETLPEDAAAPVDDAPDALRILLVDDHPAVRRVLRELLHQQPQLSIVGDASNGLEAITQAHALRPDVILMDIVMPHMDGIAATTRLHRELPDIRILGLSTLARNEAAETIERAGAAGYFVKGTDTPRLIDELLTFHASRIADRAGR